MKLATITRYEDRSRNQFDDQILIPYLRLCTLAFLSSLVLVFCIGCHRRQQEPVIIAFFDPEWSHDQSDRSVFLEETLKEFERQTGIQVRHLPAPETAHEQLDVTRELLRSGGSGPDVYAIDIVWAGLLDQDLLDLGPFFNSELHNQDRDLVASFTVNGRVVALPYHINTGVLLYNADLLKKYGYHAPPQTWDELEKMALRIQQGERASGRKDFWGFVWPGAAGEGLTCLALEWQMSDGGGRILEPNRTVSVNNPQAIRAWERAARWIGWISPPTVTSYQDWDAMNLFEHAENAAFQRSWTSDYFLAAPNPSWHSNAHDRRTWTLGYTTLPSGKSRSAGALGGFGLAISRSTNHRAEAIALIRFLVNKEAEREAKRELAEIPPTNEIYRLPPVLKAYLKARSTDDPVDSVLAVRPSAVAGDNYEAVSRAYADTVHSVLAHQVNASTAASLLQNRLAQITGFPKGPPGPTPPAYGSRR